MIEGKAIEAATDEIHGHRSTSRAAPRWSAFLPGPPFGDDQLEAILINVGGDA